MIRGFIYLLSMQPFLCGVYRFNINAAWLLNPLASVEKLDCHERK